MKGDAALMKPTLYYAHALTTTSYYSYIESLSNQYEMLRIEMTSYS